MTVYVSVFRSYSGKCRAVGGRIPTGSGVERRLLRTFVERVRVFERPFVLFGPEGIYRRDKREVAYGGRGRRGHSPWMWMIFKVV